MTAGDAFHYHGAGEKRYGHRHVFLHINHEHDAACDGCALLGYDSCDCLAPWEDAPMTDLGYVVIEWDQASGRPGIASDDVYPTAASAELAADVARRETLRVGRRKRYTVARVEGLGHE